MTETIASHFPGMQNLPTTQSKRTEDHDKFEEKKTLDVPMHFVTDIIIDSFILLGNKYCEKYR